MGGMIMVNTLGEILNSIRETLEGTPKVEKWEYKTIEGIPHSDLLNRMGIEGWEMCGVCNLPLAKPIYYFKRRPPSEPMSKDQESH